MKPKPPSFLIQCLRFFWIAVLVSSFLLASPPPSRAAADVTLTVTMDGAAVAGTFVSLTGPDGQYGGVTGEDGQIVFSGVADGDYTAAASASGTSVGSTSLSVPSTSSASLTLRDSGNKFKGLGAYGAQVSQIVADGLTGVFYLNTSGIPSLWRTGDYGGHWAPVTLSNDDPDYGMNGISTANAITTSGYPGEIAAVVENKVYYSRDFGVTWKNVPLPEGFSMPKLLWGHVGQTSVLYLHSETLTRMAYALMPTLQVGTPPAGFTPLEPGGASFKTANDDRLTMARGESAPILAVASVSGDPEPFGLITPSQDTQVTLYEIAPGKVSRSTSVSVPLPPEAAPAGLPSFIGLGGPHTGPVVGDGKAPNTLLVYAYDTDGGSAVMSTYADGSWVSTDTTRFIQPWDENVDPQGSFVQCGANSPMIIGGIPAGGSGEGSVASVASCWVTQSGTTLTVRPVAHINNNTGMAFDAAYGQTFNVSGSPVVNQVLISGDGWMGATKSARMDTSLNRPAFPEWPELADPGIDPASGGIAVTGIEAPVVKDMAYGPTAEDMVVVFSFSGGGRTLGSSDGGETWMTLQAQGGAAVDWWENASGQGWIMKGTTDHGELLAALALDGAAGLTSGSTLAKISNSRSTDLYGAENAQASAIAGLPGTNSAFVGFTYQPENVPLGGSLRKITLSGGSGGITASLSPAVSGVTGPVVALDYCPPSAGTDPQVADNLFVAIRSSGDDQNPFATGALAVFENASGTPQLKSTFAGNFRDVRVQCSSGIAYAGRYEIRPGGEPGDPPFYGLLKSVDGGENWSNLTAPQTDPVFNRFRSVETLAVNPEDAAEVVVVSSAGDIISSADGGETWTVQNDTEQAEARHFGGERPGDIEIFSGSAFEAHQAAGSGPQYLQAAESQDQALFGTSSGLFSADVRSTAGAAKPKQVFLPIVSK